MNETNADEESHRSTLRGILFAKRRVRPLRFSCIALHSTRVALLAFVPGAINSGLTLHDTKHNANAIQKKHEDFKQQQLWVVLSAVVRLFSNGLAQHAAHHNATQAQRALHTARDSFNQQ